MTEHPTPSDLAAWVLDHGVGLTPARQRHLAKGLLRMEAQSAIRGRAVAIYQERARVAEARVKAVQDVLNEPDAMIGTRLHVSVDRIHRALESVTPSVQ